MAELQMMEFPPTVEEYMESYKIVDTEQVYTNGSELVPIFRMRQWFEHLNGADWISVKERLPDNGKYVLAYSADDDYMTVEARHKFDVFQITHWMPLPEPPMEGGGEDG